MKKEILKLIIEFKNECKKYKKNFRIPQCKDISQTYQYRWFNSFYEKCRKDYDQEDMVEIIKCLVKYAKDNRILNVGASLLNRSDIVSIACKMFNDEVSDIENIIINLQNKMKLVDKNFESFLLKKTHRDGYNNLIIMYLDGRIDLNFISLSKSCIKALSKIKEDRDLLPIPLQIVKRRLKILDLVGISKIKKIMNGEFNDAQK